MTSQHPFLEDSFHIRWKSLTAGHVVPDMEEAITRGEAAINAIEKLPDGQESFANTFMALEEAMNAVGIPWGKVNHLDSVNDHKELREAHRKVLPKVSAFFSAIPLNQELYRKLKAFRESGAFRELQPVEKRFVTETLQDFEDAGANQDEKTRKRLQEIEATLAGKTKKFSENVLDSTNAYEKIVDSAEELSGLPESLKEAARVDALQKGHGTEDNPKFRFTLQAPSFVPALRFLDSDALRRELYEAFTRIAHTPEFENEPLIREILALRNEKAALLGREAFPDWVLARRMAKSGQEALAFVEDLHDKTKAAFDTEINELMAFKARKTETEPGPLENWEMAYWAEKLRKETYAFDEEEVRPYFPVDSVMSGLFQLVEKIFAIRVERQKDPQPETWHPDVRFYNIFDAAGGNHLGSFHADWYPRESKRSGAWMNPLMAGQARKDGSLEPNLGFIGGNMNPPVGGRPALLTHNEVETIFHEFGHLLHHVLSEVPIRSLGGTNVAWDFVELPSQIMENWCWERESLDLFARHFETNEPIPEALFDKMLKARNFGAASAQMRQLYFGKLDLALHLKFDPESERDLDAFIEEETRGYLPPVKTRYPGMARRFEHLFAHPTGYASGYYSYKWAEVLDADAFTRFKKDGIMNPETGKAFRTSILAKGNSEEPDKLFQAFMGREPDPRALLIRLGLEQATA